MESQETDDQSLKVPGQNSEGASLTRSTSTADSSLFDASSQAPSSQSSDLPDTGGPSDAKEQKQDTVQEAPQKDAELNEKSAEPAPSDAGSQKSRRSRQAESENADDSDTSEESEANPYYNDYTTKDIASQLDSKGLYEAYVMKLQRQDEKSKKPKKEKSSRLVRSFVDYVRLLEERIEQLENKVGKADGPAPEEEDQPNEQGSTVAEETTDEAKPADAEDTEAASGERWADVALETKFFQADNEFDAEGGYVWGNIRKKGTYQCNEDPKVLIRVLYNWAEDVAEKPPTLTEGETPNPKHIDPLAIGVTSEPISTFFSKQLDLDVDSNNLVRFSKPFRPLLRNLQPLREQLVKLEGMFETDEDEPQSAVPTSVESVEKKEDDKEAEEQPTEGDALPFPPEENEQDIEPFDRKEAIEHFRILIQWIEKYLKKALDLLERFKTGREEKVAFENLWMLFESGDTVYSHFQEGGQVLENDVGDIHIKKRRDVPQAYRVIATAGGIPLQKSLAPKTKDPDEEMNEALLRKMAWNNKRVRMMSPALLRTTTEDSGPMKMKRKYSPLYVYCFYIDFDGSKYGTVTEIFVFKPHDGDVDIRSLEAYPYHFMTTPAMGLKPPEHQGEGNKKDKLLERGRKFIDLTTVSHMSYEGLTIGESREEISSAVIVDFKLAYQEYKQQFPEPDEVVPKFSSLTSYWQNIRERQVIEMYRCSCAILWCHSTDCTWDQYADQQKKHRDKVESNMKLLLEEYEIEKSDQNDGMRKFKQYMEEKDLIRILPGVVPGFALRNRKWVRLDLNMLDEVKREDNWNDLVLPPGHRKMVQAMVETHAKGTRSTSGHAIDRIEMDLVRGKGKGCIILLHGAPGVGKTSTAECVATYTERPLYPITCGDIGYVPEDVEDNMEKHFKLAHKWGCVLLLDEADVFLAKRNKEDIKRNGLVSVFLRILEYYSGILFLTTNRVGTIDDAFRSRLHLTLYYPKLDEEQTIKIWKKNLDRMKTINEERIKNGRLEVKFNKKKILAWAKKYWRALQWNGRQIRNAFQTAVALGEFKSRKEAKGGETSIKPPVMDVKYFKIIAKASIQFNEYLRETHGADEEKTAKRDMIRTDYAFESDVKIKGFDGIVDYDDSDETTSGSESDISSDTESEAEDGSDNNGSDTESEESEDEKKKKKRKGKKAKKESTGKSKTSKEEKPDKGKSSDRKKRS